MKTFKISDFMDNKPEVKLGEFDVVALKTNVQLTVLLAWAKSFKNIIS